MRAERGRHVVVLGAGLAGLAAAWRLAAAGHRVTVAERALRVGGRVALADLGGEIVDPTAARVSAGDASLLGLVREAGLADVLLPLRPWRAAQWDGSRLAAAAAAGVPTGVRWLDALRLIRLPRLMRRYRQHLDPERPERAAPLDDRSLADFGALYFGRSAVEGWIEPWLAEWAPVDERQASRADFLLRFAAERGAEAAQLRAPVGRLAEALAARVAPRTGCAAAGLAVAAAGGIEVALAGGGLAADAVVLAVPAPEALRLAAPLLTPAERDLLHSTGYDAALVWIGSARELPVSVATRARVPRRAGAPFSVLALEPARESRGDPRPPGRITAIAREPWSRARLDAPDDALEKELAGEVARIVPAAVEAGAPGALFRFRSAWPRFEVGRYRALARFRAVQADRRLAGRRLYFAGDFLSAPTLAGAVASGLRAADDAIADLG